MRISEHIFKALRTGVAVAAALVGVVVLLAGSVQVCLCDPDPDQCGSECHICAESATADVPLGSVDTDPLTGMPCLRTDDEACRHVVVSIGDLFAQSFVVSVPTLGGRAPPDGLEMSRTPRPWRLRPMATAPPDSIPGVYLTTATRRYPLS